MKKLPTSSINSQIQWNGRHSIQNISNLQSLSTKSKPERVFMPQTPLQQLKNRTEISSKHNAPVLHLNLFRFPFQAHWGFLSGSNEVWIKFEDGDWWVPSPNWIHWEEDVDQQGNDLVQFWANFELSAISHSFGPERTYYTGGKEPTHSCYYDHRDSWDPTGPFPSW